MDNLTFITSNKGKSEQLGRYLQLPLVQRNVELTEIQSLDLQEVLKHKCIEAYKVVEGPVLVDDVSLVINAFQQLPGPLVKWFAAGMGYDNLCKALSPFKDKSATAYVGIGLYDGKEFKLFLGQIDGTITDRPLGRHGFGWDVVLIPKGYKQTRAQMNEEDYDATSPRRMALEKLTEYLTSKA